VWSISIDGTLNSRHLTEYCEIHFIYRAVGRSENLGGQEVIEGSLVDILWGQPIKLIQVASNSELCKNPWNDLLFFEIVPSHCFGASEASKLTASKIKYESFGPKFLIPR
jgi:hypothetical protein